MPITANANLQRLLSRQQGGAPASPEAGMPTAPVSNAAPAAEASISAAPTAEAPDSEAVAIVAALSKRLEKL